MELDGDDESELTGASISAIAIDQLPLPDPTLSVAVIFPETVPLVSKLFLELPEGLKSLVANVLPLTDILLAKSFPPKPTTHEPVATLFTVAAIEEPEVAALVAKFAGRVTVLVPVYDRPKQTINDADTVQVTTMSFAPPVGFNIP